jgi:hypothetical protein
VREPGALGTHSAGTPSEPAGSHANTLAPALSKFDQEVRPGEEDTKFKYAALLAMTEVTQNARRESFRPPALLLFTKKVLERGHMCLPTKVHASLLLTMSMS